MMQRRIFLGLLLGLASIVPLPRARAQEDDRQRCERLEREERDITERLESNSLGADERQRLEQLRAQLHEERERTCPH
jgi:hypothetical protein